MTVAELIEHMSRLPQDAKVLINEELGWYELTSENVEYRKVFIVWSSDYNNNKTPYTHFSSEPRDSVYVRGNGKPDYVNKTIGDEYVLLLG